MIEPITIRDLKWMRETSSGTHWLVLFKGCEAKVAGHEKHVPCEP